MCGPAAALRPSVARSTVVRQAFPLTRWTDARWDGDRRAGHIRVFFFQAEDGIRDVAVTGVQTCALPICEGLNQARAHVHLELNLMFDRNFESWHDHTFRDPNHNGIYNGINLAGLDIARFFLEREKRPDLSVPQFLTEEEIFYKVTVPDSSHFDLRKFYPWMVKNVSANAQSWEVSFARSGVPLQIEARNEIVTQPTLIYVKKSAVDCTYLTRGELAGRGDHAHLTETGVRLMQLLIWPE